DITQMSQQMRQDDPGPQTIEERGRPLSDIDILPLHWLWPGRILRGKLTILEGDSGLGKSLFTLDLASRITTGRPMPDGSAGVKGPTDQDIRPGLFPLALLAQNTGCAILIVHHHPQGSFGNPLLYRSSDTLSTLAGSRTGLLIVEHPSDQNTCILATTKNKFSAKASNLTYQIVGNAEGIPSIRWLGTNHTPTTSLLKGSPHHLHYSF